MKICHLIGSLQYGGAERQFVNLMNNLDAFEKHGVFLTEKPGLGFYDLLDHNIINFFLGMRLRAAPLYINKLARYLQRNEIAILQTHMFWANLYGSIAGKLAGVPVIITTEHGKNPWKKWYHRWLERQIITRFADKRICVSRDIFNIRRDQDGIPEEKLVTIMNGVPVRSQLTTKTITKKKCIILGTVGRLVDAKDFTTLVIACSRLKEWGIDFVCHIIGDGPLRKSLQDQINTRHLRDYVKLEGYQSNVSEWLDRLDIFVMSSIREGQPVALLEAMGAGLPVVATEVGGIPDTLEHGKDGLLVPPGSPDHLASSLQIMIVNQELRNKYGRNSYRRLKNNFSIQAACKLHIELYYALLGTKNK